MVGSEFGMDPSFLVSVVQVVGGVMVWEIFPRHNFGSLVPIEHHLNVIDYLRLLHPFMTTVWSHHFTNLRSSQTVFGT